MNNYPEYVEVNGKEYKINTDFRIALECQKVANDDSVGDLERALGVIYLLFGEEGINNREDWEKLSKMAQKYLLCGKQLEKVEGEPDMDFEQDMDYIEASFMSDYRIDLGSQNMHWWKFTKLINGLSNSELGDCCILNRVRNLRNYDTSDIKDHKLKDKIEKAKKAVALNKNKKPLTKEQEESQHSLREQLGIGEGVI